MKNDDFKGPAGTRRDPQGPAETRRDPQMAANAPKMHMKLLLLRLIAQNLCGLFLKVYIFSGLIGVFVCGSAAVALYHGGRRVL